MEFDKGLELAVILGWKDLMRGDRLISARVEYDSRQGMPIDSVSVWTVRSWGYHDRVCDYWTSASATHPVGLSFSNSHHSEALAKALGFIMKNQGEFTRPGDSWRAHLVRVQPPEAALLAEAATWMEEIKDG